MVGRHPAWAGRASSGDTHVGGLFLCSSLARSLTYPCNVVLKDSTL